MQQTTEPNPNAATFASLLAALAAPAPKPEPALEWEDEPAEELSTLSYENALRTHARYRPAPPPMDLPPASAASRAAAPMPATAEPAASPRVAKRTPQPASVRGKNKTASITIRMNEEEAEQLRHRAEEAGMTISAYLRSCTFEAEALRAQVKEAMSELRAATVAAAVAAQKSQAPVAEKLPPPRRGWKNMVERLMPNSPHMPHAVRA